MTPVTITRELLTQLLEEVASARPRTGLQCGAPDMVSHYIRGSTVNLAAELRAALDEPQAITDTQRLEWLEKRECWLGLEGDTVARPVITAGGCYHQTVRATIDAAIQQEKP